MSKLWCVRLYMPEELDGHDPIGGAVHPEVDETYKYSSERLRESKRQELLGGHAQNPAITVWEEERT